MLLSEYVTRLSETVERLEYAADQDLLTPLQATLAGVALDAYRTKLEAARVSLEGLGDVSVLVGPGGPLHSVSDACERLHEVEEREPVRGSLHDRYQIYVDCHPGGEILSYDEWINS